MGVWGNKRTSTWLDSRRRTDVAKLVERGRERRVIFSVLLLARPSPSSRKEQRGGGKRRFVWSWQQASYVIIKYHAWARCNLVWTWWYLLLGIKGFACLDPSLIRTILRHVPTYWWLHPQFKKKSDTCEIHPTVCVLLKVYFLLRSHLFSCFRKSLTS